MVGSEVPVWMSRVKGNSLPWLLEKANPCVRLRTLTELLECPPSDGEVGKAERAVWAYPPVAELLSVLDAADPMRPNSAWHMALFKKHCGDLDVLHRMGVPSGHPAITRACDRWLNVELVPHAECYPMQMIAGLVRYADEDDPRLPQIVEYVVHNEPFTDGNRPGILRYGAGRRGCEGSHSCHMAAAKALWAVIGLPVAKRTPEVLEFMRLGSHYLARHALYQSSHKEGKAINKQFVGLHLPFAQGCDTDVLDLLDIATQVGLEADRSIADALDLLLSKQNSGGRWKVEAPSRWAPDKRRLAGHVSTLEKPGEESKWITLASLVVVKRCHDFLTGARRTDVLKDLEDGDPEVLRRYPFSYDSKDEQRVRDEWMARSLLFVDLIAGAR